ncbi:MAG TPA: hypothetical protein VG271_16635 [Beijerinckiaceae bacterium]|jgi:hypothetical protein|nr:hypothetical protein [Beijerinckiaceae bacterium]
MTGLSKRKPHAISVAAREFPLNVVAVGILALGAACGPAAAAAKNSARLMTRLTPANVAMVEPGVFPYGVHRFFNRNTPSHGQYYWRHGRRHLAL